MERYIIMEIISNQTTWDYCKAFMPSKERISSCIKYRIRNPSQIVKKKASEKDGDAMLKTYTLKWEENKYPNRKTDAPCVARLESALGNHSETIFSFCTLLESGVVFWLQVR
eukprot:gb/GECH01006513.1/.p1 GENE.gb/GECH01006513.1/~~gb/GECH01006513.1/.p1  ORF type:complete len:112 (+),score=8.33 gb/GECH01006513.1/:1-336(+)